MKCSIKIRDNWQEIEVVKNDTKPIERCLPMGLTKWQNSPYAVYEFIISCSYGSISNGEYEVRFNGDYEILKVTNRSGTTWANLIT